MDASERLEVAVCVVSGGTWSEVVVMSTERFLIR